MGSPYKWDAHPTTVGAEYCDALYRAAEAAICLMEYSHGLTLYREYLSKCPESPGAWHGLAICLEATGHGDEALRAYEKALRLHLRSGGARDLLWAGWCAIKLGRYELAYELFRESVRMDPGYAYTWHSLAVAAMRIGRREEGMEAMERYRALVRERPYERRECEGVSMLIESLESLQRVADGQGIVEVVRDLLTRAVTKHGMRCKHVLGKYVADGFPGPTQF